MQHPSMLGRLGTFQGPRSTCRAPCVLSMDAPFAALDQSRGLADDGMVRSVAATPVIRSVAFGQRGIAVERRTLARLCTRPRSDPPGGGAHGGGAHGARPTPG